MTDRRALVLRALLRDEQTEHDIQSASGAPLKEIRLAVAALCGSGWIAQTSWDSRQHARRHRITDAGREWLSERGDA